MVVQKVCIQADALQVCMTHALSTEKEEVMGLLIGEIDDMQISHIHTVYMLRRLDKRKDRVEISPEQLSNASTEAELNNLGLRTRVGKPLRIIGWYHSHPHITVWPSHVDVRTQAMYQLMDDDFIGLIVSCFDGSSPFLGQIQVTCFQSQNIGTELSPNFERVEIPQEIISCDVMSDACLESLISLPKILFEEECSAYQKSLRYTDQDLLTAIQNASVFSQSVIQIMEYICSPIVQDLEKLLQERKLKLEKLKREAGKVGKNKR